MSFLSEFRKFAMRGNVMELAIGVVMGGAFGKIVSSLVSDIIMPLIGVLVGGINFQQWVITLKKASVGADDKVIPAVTLNIGSFIQTTIDFLIIALAIFVVIRIINKLINKEEKTPLPPPPPTKEEELLTQIRDILKEKK